jgi:hypothetical protein
MALVQAAAADDNVRLQLKPFVEEVEKLRKKGKSSEWFKFYMKNERVLPFDKNDPPPLTETEALLKLSYTTEMMCRRNNYALMD